jgi:hypothetical protein
VDLRRAGAALLAPVVLALGLLVPAPASATVPRSSTPFAGTGTWVSVFAGDAVWDRPRLHVQRMHDLGVDTLYLQTASSTTPVSSDVYRPARLAGFLHAAHARGMKVVAWYLPPLRRVGREHDRAMAAIGFRTGRGQTFDGFALDIEPSATSPSGDGMIAPSG